jgi:hypothetical protein
MVSQDEISEESLATYPGMLEKRGVVPVKGTFSRATPFPTGWSTTPFL